MYQIDRRSSYGVCGCEFYNMWMSNHELMDRGDIDDVVPGRSVATLQKRGPGREDEASSPPLTWSRA